MLYQRYVLRSLRDLSPSVREKANGKRSKAKGFFFTEMQRVFQARLRDHRYLLSFEEARWLRLSKPRPCDVYFHSPQIARIDPD
jgi:hypothetical protein